VNGKMEMEVLEGIHRKLNVMNRLLNKFRVTT
jgi:hypothetical protein